MTLLVAGKFNVNNYAHIIQGKENLAEWFSITATLVVVQ